MTTTTTDAPGIYEALEQLHLVKPDPALVAKTTAVNDIFEQYRETLRQARELLIEHHYEASQIIDKVRADTAVTDAVDDGLNELLHELSGAQALHLALHRLSTLACPDGLTIDEI